MSFARVLCLTLGLSAIAACGGNFEDDCKDGCDRVCEGEDARSADEVATCKTTCTTVATQAKAYDCEDEAKDLQSCGDENACDATVTAKCQEKTQAYIRCAQSYCSDHPDSTVCNNSQT